MPHIYSHRLDVRFRDCDALGHVNNAVYLTYLEQARLHCWRELWGFGEAGSPLPGVIMARAEIDYRLPAHYGQTLEIRIALAAIGRTSFTYDYEIVDADNRSSHRPGRSRSCTTTRRRSRCRFPTISARKCRKVETFRHIVKRFT